MALLGLAFLMVAAILFAIDLLRTGGLVSAGLMCAAAGAILLGYHA